jgi:hypothetical protein
VADSCEHRGDGGAGEDVPAHRGVQHPFAHVPSVRGLMSRPAAYKIGFAGGGGGLSKEENEQRERREREQH